MLGIEISERTVSRILRRSPRPAPARPGRRSCTITSVRWFRLTSSPLPTITLKVLFVFIVQAALAAGLDALRLATRVRGVNGVADVL
jgi:hypothetical protein